MEKISSNIRINKDDWDKLKEIAEKNKRSMNKEIEYIIDKRINEYKDKEKELENSYIY